MSITWPEIVQIVQSRRERQGPTIREMIDVRDRYNGDWVVPYLSDQEAADLPPLTPAIIADAIDNNGMRAASVLPAIIVPAVNPTKQQGTRSREYANTRRRILGATWYHSKMNLLLRRAYRHLFGYATVSMVVVPDMKMEMPRVFVRDPLTAYPDERAAEDYSPPLNVAFVFGKSINWIRANFPELSSKLPRESSGHAMWDLVEWIDDEVTVIGLLGPRDKHMVSDAPMRYAYELRRYPNLCGMVPAICPTRVTLDRISSQLSKVTGITDLMARLMALDVIAREKSIFPDRYVIGTEGRMPQIVGGEWKDGRTGQMNIVLDANNIGALNFAPDQSSTQSIDRLERNARISGGLVPQMGGETYGALRTGRGIDALMGAAVDPRIQEMQEIMEAHLPHLNAAILKTYKHYWGSKTFILTSGWPNDPGVVEFTPEKHIEATDNVVSYPIAGADSQGTTIILGQLLGANLISRRTAMERHPMIGDATAEMSRIDEEVFERAATEAILNQAMQGALPLIFLAEIEKARRTDPNGDIFTAIEKADRAIRERQAAEAPPPQEGQIAAPETEPGLAAPQVTQQPGQPEMGQGRSIGPTPDQEGLRELMNALAAGSRQIGA